MFGGGAEGGQPQEWVRSWPLRNSGDFDAKYYNQESSTVTDPELRGTRRRDPRDRCFRISGGGRLRTGAVDSFVKEDGEVVFNEINTMPGFTAISMYPMLWEARGVSKEALVEKLLAHGLKRLTDRSARCTGEKEGI